MIATHFSAHHQGAGHSHAPKIHPFNTRTLNASEKNTVVRPFLRWVGGKQRLLPSLIDRLPTNFKGRYFEPFLGGGSLFLSRTWRRAEISDINPHLVNAYRQVRDNPNDIHILLAKHAAELERREADYYYEIRDTYNSYRDRLDLEQAGRFIFLIHSNYNGIHRVNRAGDYNVPYGHRPKPHFPSLEQLHAVSKRLDPKRVKIEHRGYDSILPLLRSGDLIYIDPPYPVLSRTANFTEYAVERFSEEEQDRLAMFARAASERGAHIMISIAEVPQILEHYSLWHIHRTHLKRTVSAKRPPISASELIITSYPTKP